jgi:hypothetical protein
MSENSKKVTKPKPKRIKPTSKLKKESEEKLDGDSSKLPTKRAKKKASFSRNTGLDKVVFQKQEKDDSFYEF